MASRRTVHIAVDPENAAQEWWVAFHQAVDAGTAPPALVPLADPFGPDAIEVPAAEASALLAWCASLPGWADGPSYAPHPLLVVEVTQRQNREPGPEEES